MDSNELLRGELNSNFHGLKDTNAWYQESLKDVVETHLGRARQKPGGSFELGVHHPMLVNAQGNLKSWKLRLGSAMAQETFG